MLKWAIVALVVSCCLLAGCSSGQGSEEATRLTVPGSGACEQVLKRLAAAFNDRHPGLQVMVPSSTGTSGGIKAVVNDTHPLGRVGRPLKVDELKSGVQFLPLADDAVIFAVGSHVKAGSFTSEQLAAIFSGKITEWQQVGGPRKPIRVVIRQAGETSLSIVRRNLPPFQDVLFSEQAKTAFHDYEMVDLLNKFPTSIGFLTNSSVAMPGNVMRPVGVDAVFPTPENLRSGAYPLRTTYGLAFKPEGLNSLATQFIAFIYSEEGKRIIESMGLVALTRKS